MNLTGIWGEWPSRNDSSERVSADGWMMIHVDIYKREFSSRKEFFFSPFSFNLFPSVKEKVCHYQKGVSCKIPFFFYVFRGPSLESINWKALPKQPDNPGLASLASPSPSASASSPGIKLPKEILLAGASRRTRLKVLTFGGVGDWGTPSTGIAPTTGGGAARTVGEGERIFVGVTVPP